jgi:hypothetical protein
MSRRSLALLLVALTVGCARGRPEPHTGRPVAAASVGGPSAGTDTDAVAVVFDLYEPVVRHLMKPLETRASARPWVVYVNLPWGLPDEAFCARFADGAIPVRPFGDAATDTADQSAYIINICNPSARKVHWEGPDRARILVSHHATSESFCGCDAPSPVPVRRAGGQWVVAVP